MPTSKNSENERRIQDAVEKLHGDITVVVIAHRLSTIRRTDNIVFIDEGRVKTTGTWKDLMRRQKGRLNEMTGECIDHSSNDIPK